MSETPRFYIPKNSLGYKLIPLPPAIHRHAIRVLRLTSGDKILLFDGEGLEMEARLVKDDQGNYHAEILDSRRKDSDTKIRFLLFQAPVKKERWEWLLEKAAELGVFSIHPILTDFTEPDETKNFSKKKTRWESILQSACEQSGRVFVPEISNPVSFPEALEKAPGSRLLFHHQSPAEPLEKIFNQLTSSETVSLFIGPRGGFSNQEVAAASSKNIPIVSLGNLTLRAETAGIAALAYLSIRLSW